MKAIVESGYSFPPEEIKKLLDAERQRRAADLAKADQKQRDRIEKQILQAVQKQLVNQHVPGEGLNGLFRRGVFSSSLQQLFRKR